MAKSYTSRKDQEKAWMVTEFAQEQSINQERWPAYGAALMVMQFLGGLHLP